MTYQDKASYASSPPCITWLGEGLNTGWRRCIGSLILIRHFPPNSPIISGSFVKSISWLGEGFCEDPLCQVRPLPLNSQRLLCHLRQRGQRQRIVQGGKDAWDAFSCRSLSAKEPLSIGFFCGKWPVKIRHPTHLPYPVWDSGGMFLRHLVYSWLLPLSLFFSVAMVTRRKAADDGIDDRALDFIAVRYVWAGAVVECDELVQCVAVCGSVLQCVAAVHESCYKYGVATSIRLLEIIGLFCKRAL